MNAKAGRELKIMNTINTTKKVIMIAAALSAIAVVLGIGIMIMGRNSNSDIEGLLDLGAKYMEEMDYENAVAVYESILEIDAYNVEAYLGIVEAYRQMGKLDKALEYARRGYELTGDERLGSLILLLEKEMASVLTPSPEPTPIATPEVTPSPEPAPTATPEVTPSPEPAPTATPEVTPSPEPTPTAPPEVTPSPEPTPTATPEVTPEPEEEEEDDEEEDEPTPEETPEPMPTATPEVTPSPEPSAVPEPGASGSLSGRVCKASDGSTPIGNAVISAYQNDILCNTFFVDGEGNYMIELPAGEYRFEVAAEGYMPFQAYVTVVENYNNYLETVFMVEGAAAGNGIAGGNILNALTGGGIEGVSLTIRNGWGNIDTGDIVASLVTREGGAYDVTLPYGNYTVYAAKEGYIATSVNIIVKEGAAYNQNGTMTPVISGNNFRIVLTWGQSPSDLDSHVSGTLSNGNPFHVYFGQKYCYDGEIEVCNLDVDDTTSYGPETITLNVTTDKPYYYYIHRYSSSGTIAASGAQVRVYQGENAVAVFNAPTDQGSGIYWNVFAIVNGNLVIKNTITSSPDLSYAENATPTPDVGTEVKNGLFQSEDGNWYYYVDNQVATDYSGLVSYNDAWWCVSDGCVNFNYTGLWNDSALGWWYVENGTVNFDYNGQVEYDGAWWNVNSGRVVF